MKRMDAPIPTTWRLLDPGRAEYAIGDGLTATFSGVQALPEDPASWMRVELEQRAAGLPLTGAVIRHTRLGSGWPATIGEATVGGDRLLLVLYHLLEYAAVATLRGPAPAFSAEQPGVLEVFGQATVIWGDPPLSLARLLEAVERPVESSTTS